MGMALYDHLQAASNQLAGQLNVGQNVKRPDTALEATISRMSAILSRVHANAQRAETAANTVLGYEGETADVGKAPAAVPTSVRDYLSEIEIALGRLEYGLGRLT